MTLIHTFAKSSLLVLLTNLVQPAWALSSNQTQLFLMVQQHGEPLFKKVDLSIYKLNNLSKTKIYQSRHHTAALLLPAGNYIAQVRYENQMIRQLFHLSSHDKHFMTLDLPGDKPTTLSTR
ncbi:hypothetical protein [Thiofilum flexile]|uniref:hypothetical protein n=1 Tax=Thiofilum flexile TaxID=125627 RepID=UPI00037CF7D2|nr:hypothetical protein [Thiofilum flexile]